MVGVGSSRLPYHNLFMVNGGRGSSPLPYHAPFMVNGGCGSSHLPNHAPFMVNSGRGSSLLPHHPPFYARWWAWFKSCTYHAPFMVNGGRGSSPLPMPRPFYDVNQCNKKNISNDLYCCFFCLICFYMTIDYYYYLTVLDKKYAKIFHEELLLWRRRKIENNPWKRCYSIWKFSNAIHTENYTKSRMIWCL